MGRINSRASGNDKKELVAQTVWSERGDAVFYEVRNEKRDAWPEDAFLANEREIAPPPMEAVDNEPKPVLTAAKLTAAKLTAAMPGVSGAAGAIRHKGIVWLFVFAAGLIAGTVFVNYIAAGQIQVSGVWMADAVDKILAFEADVGLFVHIFIKRGLVFIFLAGITLLWHRILLLYLSTAYFGFCFGVVVSLLTITYGPSGLFWLLKLLLPHYLLYVPAYMLLLLWAKERRRIRYRGRAGAIPADGASLLLMAAMVVCGVVLECYVNPIWIRFFERFF